MRNNPENSDFLIA